MTTESRKPSSEQSERLVKLDSVQPSGLNVMKELRELSRRQDVTEQQAARVGEYVKADASDLGDGLRSERLKEAARRYLSASPKPEPASEDKQEYGADVVKVWRGQQGDAVEWRLFDSGKIKYFDEVLKVWIDSYQFSIANQPPFPLVYQRPSPSPKPAAMTPEEQEAQRRSFAYGNVALHNPATTRKDIDDAAERLKPPDTTDAEKVESEFKREAHKATHWHGESTKWMNRAEAAEAKLLATERDRDSWKARAEANASMCTQCNEVIPAYKHKGHCFTCPSHPMRAVEAKLAAVTGERDAAMKVVEAYDNLDKFACLTTQQAQLQEALTAAKLALSGGKVGA